MTSPSAASSSTPKQARWKRFVNALVWLIFFIIMFVQVLTEEHRLRHDFGEEYEKYCKRTRRF